MLSSMRPVPSVFLLLTLAACSSTQHTGVGTPSRAPESEPDATTSSTEPDASAAIESPDVLEDHASALTTVDTGPSPLATHERFPIVPMHLVPAPGATGEDAHVDLELRGDGSLYAHGQLFGQLSGDRVLGTDGREILAVAPDGTVTLHGLATRMHVQSDGTISLPNGATLAFEADGAPTMAMPGGQAHRGPARMQGYRPEARSTADLLALIVATVQLPR
jgi:hypothetical protein